MARTKLTAVVVIQYLWWGTKCVKILFMTILESIYKCSDRFWIMVSNARQWCFATRRKCLLNYLSIPVIFVALRIYYTRDYFIAIWSIFTIPRIFRHVCNWKEIIQWKLDEIVKIVNYLSNFVVPDRTFCVSFSSLKFKIFVLNKELLLLSLRRLFSFDPH